MAPAGRFATAARCSLRIILNRVASSKHELLLREGLGKKGGAVVGAVYRDPGLELPSRHLGLVQAVEHDGIEPFIERPAQEINRLLPEPRSC